MIGDTKLDALAAKNANIKSLGVRYGYGDEAQLLAHFDAVFDNVSQAVIYAKKFLWIYSWKFRKNAEFLFWLITVFIVLVLKIRFLRPNSARKRANQRWDIKAELNFKLFKKKRIFVLSWNLIVPKTQKAIILAQASLNSFWFCNNKYILKISQAILQNTSPQNFLKILNQLIPIKSFFDTIF